MKASLANHNKRSHHSGFGLGVCIALILVLSCGVFSLSAFANTELTIEITEGRDDATPVAIVPFAWTGELSPPEDIAEIIQANLERSGQFKPLARGDMLSRPSARDEVFFRDWRLLGSQWLLIGRIASVGDRQYRLSYELFDVFKGEAFGAAESITFRDFRKAAHIVSDRIYQQLTGIPGAFATQILYVNYQFVDANNHRFRLQLADSDGHRAVTILESSEPIMSPTWSPNGREIAYVSFHEDGRPGIFRQDIYSGERRKITGFKGVNGAPDWSPDGTRLAFSLSKDGNVEIYTVELASGKLRRMTNHSAIDTEPRWNGDGSEIIFTSDRGGGPQIYSMNASSRAVKRLSFEGGYNARGTMTADNRYLVMVHRAAGKFHVAVQDLNLGTFRILTETSLDESPSVAPNGAMVLYATKRGNQGVLGAVSIDGRAKFRLPSKTGGVREPAWSPFLR